MYLEEWHWEQRMIDIINDSMRGRYKMTLGGRLYHPDASRAGETLSALVKDREKRPEDRQWGDYVGE